MMVNYTVALIKKINCCSFLTMGLLWVLLLAFNVQQRYCGLDAVNLGTSETRDSFLEAFQENMSSFTTETFTTFLKDCGYYKYFTCTTIDYQCLNAYEELTKYNDLLTIFIKNKSRFFNVKALGYSIHYSYRWANLDSFVTLFDALDKFNPKIKEKLLLAPQSINTRLTPIDTWTLATESNTRPFLTVLKLLKQLEDPNQVFKKLNQAFNSYIVYEAPKRKRDINKKIKEINDSIDISIKSLNEEELIPKLKAMKMDLKMLNYQYTTLELHSRLQDLSKYDNDYTEMLLKECFFKVLYSFSIKSRNQLKATLLTLAQRGTLQTDELVIVTRLYILLTLLTQSK